MDGRPIPQPAHLPSRLPGPGRRRQRQACQRDDPGLAGLPTRPVPSIEAKARQAPATVIRLHTNCFDLLVCLKNSIAIAHEQEEG